MLQTTSLRLGAPPEGPERGLLSVDDLTAAELDRLVERSCAFYADRADHDAPLRGRIVGTLFTRTSTRTRTAFATAALRLGAQVMAYGPGELQLATGESLEDTARVFGRMLDVLVARTAGPLDDLRRFARHSGLPVVNAMAAEEHPTQAVADLTALRLRFGALRGLSVLYVGEGNNTASALALALARLPECRLTLLTPPGYGLGEKHLAAARAAAARTGSRIEQTHAHDDLPRDVDAVYTTRWQTTGTAKPDASWRQVFRPYHVDAALMRRWPDAVFLHDLPAHRGDEVAADVLDGARSLAWVQAEAKLTSAMAVLESVARRDG
ncbi:ornithine carbamoyltransferase [Actinomadura atramentaria]|uniref:ornithine carbamoyltransferase n=1 Tax=Actinomadura atramentaria TaxID=1990 RepID=UPI00036A2EB3|nr:hypothetical protein [Actinomadura atramentaria]